MKLKREVELVTGADNGIGKAIVLVFVHEGTGIAVNGRY